jgi:hypothetical protein
MAGIFKTQGEKHQFVAVASIQAGVDVVAGDIEKAYAFSQHGAESRRTETAICHQRERAVFTTSDG